MITPKNREEWLKARLNGIGASEAAAIIGKNPYMTNVDLWEIKTKRKQATDISDKPYVKYGTKAEEHLRALFALDFPQYSVGYSEFEMISNNEEMPFAFSTLDGYLVHNFTKELGVLEIKTTEILNASQWKKWDEKVPDNYYCQILHQLLTTGYDFAILKAQIKYKDKKGDLCATTRHYHFNRSELVDDLEYLKSKEIEFWQCVQENRMPNLILPEI